MNEKESELIAKYNVQGPRYTSYPTVPYWDNALKQEQWKKLVKESFKKYNDTEGISIYIHLPYCQSLCTYCGCNVRITNNHAVELSYISSLLKEWNQYLQMFQGVPIIKELHLGGGTPTFFKPENLGALIEKITSRAIIHKNAEFSFEAHPNSTSKKHLETLYNSGFRRLSLGIQDFDPEVQKVANRIQSFETVKEVTEQARTIGYTSINYDLIYGLPLQSSQTISKTIAQVNMLRPDRIAFYSYAHVPWLKPAQKSFAEKDLPTSSQKRILYEQGRKLLLEDGYHEIGMDHFALGADALCRAMEDKTLHRNFMGYTTSNTHILIGLGASSISDIWTAFSQNIKTVETYQSYVENKVLPLSKGHILTEEDLIIRQHILNIMCRFETSWEDASEQTPELFEGIRRMNEMEKDGLVMIDGNHLKVTEKGRAFTRNICMALDIRMWAEKPSAQIFSTTI
jgi:oxygen-independent coproporphyrinogen III oxidase